MNQELIYDVIEQIIQDVHNGDLSSIEELLKTVPESTLMGFLIEE